jgi:hypothetical protein
MSRDTMQDVLEQANGSWETLIKSTLSMVTPSLTSTDQIRGTTLSNMR